MPRFRDGITGHGLGHASRSCQARQPLHGCHPVIRCGVVADAAAWLLAGNLPPGIDVAPRALDVAADRLAEIRA